VVSFGLVITARAEPAGKGRPISDLLEGFTTIPLLNSVLATSSNSRVPSPAT
jgi:hypothetical protein